MRLASLLQSRELRGLLFDLDGTLVDSVPDISAALDATLEDFNYPPAGERRARQWVGNGARRLVRRSVAYALEVNESSVDSHLEQRVLSRFFDHYGAVVCRRTRLFPGVLETLSHWQEQGIAMACVTNKPEAFSRVILQQLELAPLLPVLVGGDTLRQSKPDPAPLLLACERLKIPVSSAVMVGDSINDVQAARAAGMPVACVSYGYNHGAPVAEAKPDVLVDCFAELR